MSERIADHCFVPPAPCADMPVDACQYEGCGKREIEHEWSMEAEEANPEPIRNKRVPDPLVQQMAQALVGAKHELNRLTISHRAGKLSRPDVTVIESCTDSLKAWQESQQ